MGAYYRPKTLSEAVHALAESGGMLLSGGTDFFPALGDRSFDGTVVDISAVRELKGIRTGAEQIEIGARTTWTELIAATLPSGFDALKAAAREIGGVQIQNAGTVGGNLCNASPAADSVPPLLALNAYVKLISISGPRIIPLADFIIGNRKTVKQPGEILTSVLVPRHFENSVSSFLKLGARKYLVISIAMVATNILLDESKIIQEVRVAVGSCAAKAQRLTRLEEALAGRALQPYIGRAITADHLQQLTPIDDVRATAAYRLDAVRTLIARALEDCARQAT